MERNIDHMILTSTLSQAHLAIVDEILLAVAGWVREYAPGWMPGALPRQI